MNNKILPNDADFDLIIDLPTDKNTPTKDEYKVLNTLFKKKKVVNVLFTEFKESILVGILFLIFSLSYVDDLILKVYPNLKNLSPYYILAAKFILIVITFWFLKHFYLIKKEN
jgi:hypothetical protein